MNAAPDDPDGKLDEATDWLLGLEAAPDDTALRADFERWLAADDRHARAWAQVNRAWTRIGERLPAHAGPGAASPSGRRPTRWQGLAVNAVAAAFAACLLLWLVPAVLLRLDADYVTAVGETRDVALADGSRLFLAPGSAVATDWSARRRSLVLLKGEAYFEVTSDSARPFTVDADGVGVTVLGTAFGLRMGADRIAVAVREGQVQVSHGGRSMRGPDHLAPGERLLVDRDSGQAVRQNARLAEIGSWRTGRLFVDGATIGEVVERLRPYQSGWTVMTDEALAARPVTGLYDLNDPARALAALVEPYGGRVRQITPLLRVVSVP